MPYINSVFVKENPERDLESPREYPYEEDRCVSCGKIATEYCIICKAPLCERCIITPECVCSKCYDSILAGEEELP
jgi:hypothetical protein